MRSLDLLLPPPLRAAVSVARALARNEGRRLFLVGGAVRDLLLERAIEDVDLVLEAGALSFAKRLGRELKALPVVHERFRTATLALAPGLRLDIAAARSETYDRPGALPRVRAPAGLAEDLARRDFTVNAMALEIAPRRSARVVDPFGGRRDLERRLLRFLHPGSPRDDPTRAFRAVRYGNRLGFSIEPRSRRFLREAIAAGSFDAVSGDRLRREVALIFSEDNWAAAAAAMTRLGLTAALLPALPAGAAVQARLSRAQRLARRFSTTWFSALLTWTSGLSEDDLATLSARLSIAGKAGLALRAWPATLRDLHGIALLPFSRGEVRAERLSVDERVAAAAALPPADRRRLLDLTEKPVHLRIRGRDLIEAGVPPGPRIGLALSAALAARREGRIPEEEELSFALQSLRDTP